MQRRGSLNRSVILFPTLVLAKSGSKGNSQPWAPLKFGQMYKKKYLLSFDKGLYLLVSYKLHIWNFQMVLKITTLGVEIDILELVNCKSKLLIKNKLRDE